MGAAYRWLVDDWQWPRAGALAAVFLLLAFPILWSSDGFAFALVFVTLPIYLFHQFEEHVGERFRHYVERAIPGADLGRPLIFAINSLLVWVPFVVVTLLAYYVDLGLGLIAVYMTGVNALLHVAISVRTRAYNPGLWTACTLMLPAAVAASIATADAADPSAALQALAIAAAIGTHAVVASLLLRAGRSA